MERYYDLSIHKKGCNPISKEVLKEKINMLMKILEKHDTEAYRRTLPTLGRLKKKEENRGLLAQIVSAAIKHEYDKKS